MTEQHRVGGRRRSAAGRSLTIGDSTRDGLAVISDTSCETSWENDPTVRVTVREMIGQRPDVRMVRAMRDLAKRAVTGARSAREVNRFYSSGSWSITFNISR